VTEEAESLAFRARALAQAHPLSSMASRYVRSITDEEGRSQPMPEAGLWAMAAFTNGYCLRRVEEEEAGIVANLPAGADDAPNDAPNDAVVSEVLEARATAAAAELRTGEGREGVVEALDLIVASEVKRRLNRWREEVDDRAWAELGEYITWWVVKGYALRVAEVAA